MKLSLALLLICAAAVCAAPASDSFLQCVADDVTGMVRTKHEGEPADARVGAGSRMSGRRTVWTVGASRARLVFPGWSLLIGPDTRLQLGATSASVLLEEGSIRIDNRPGDPEGPPVVVGTRIVEVQTLGDGRTLVSVVKGTGRVPDTMRVIALRRSATLVPFRGTVARTLDEGAQVTGAGWIPISRWVVKKLSPVQRAELERRSLMYNERAQLPGKLPLIPHETLLMDGMAMLREDVMYMSRGDIPPEGRVTIAGQVRLDRLPRPLGEAYVAASQDGGQTWDRLKWTDDHGGFAYDLVLQDQAEYQLQFGVFQVRGAKLYEATSVYPIVYREAFLPTLSDFKVCGQVIPLDGSPMTLYSDELDDYSVVFEGAVRCDAPLSRVKIEVSPDAGVRWRPAPITGNPGGEPMAGTFRVAFTPVPGAGYRFRVRAVYEQPSEKIRPHQVLADWDGPAPVRYLDQRSVERLAVLVRELEAALNKGDLTRAKALLSPHFNMTGRDLSRGLRLRLTPGVTAREAGTVQIAVDWERPGPDGDVFSGHAIFLYVKQADFALVEILGDDPFGQGRAVLRNADGTEPAPGEVVTLGLSSVFDLEGRRTGPYNERSIPDDVAFYKDDEGLAVLGTHDRRLAVLPDASLAAFAGVADRSALEYRAQIVPQAGTVLYLKTRQGGEAVLEVREAGAPDAKAPRLKLAYRVLKPGR